MAEFEALEKAAKPDLYRVNAFRIAGLPVDASSREISKQLEKIEMMKKLGGGAGGGGPLPLQPPPDADTIRAAVDRLREPEQRFVDEFFWFWPVAFGESKRDDALVALTGGDAKTAVETWARWEKDRDKQMVARHNLAVYYHAMALDMEQRAPARGKKREPDAEKKLGYCWKESVRRWQLIHDDYRTWDHLKKRVQDLGEAQITDNTVQDVRYGFPKALLSINALLAVQAAERGNYAEAERHRDIIDSSGFEKSETEAALRNAADPVRQRVRLLCKTAEDDTNKDDTKGHEVCKRLCKQAQPLLDILDSLLPEDDLTRTDAHDEVANRGLASIIAYANKVDTVEAWTLFVELIGPLEEMVVGAAAKERIAVNLKTGKDNIEHTKRFGSCFFCETNKPDDLAATEIHLFGEVVRTPTFGGTRVNWKTLTVKVPRCPECKADHDKINLFQGLGCLSSSLLGVGGCMGFGFGSQAWGAAWTLFGIFFVVGIIVMVAVEQYFKSQGVKGPGHAHNWPSIQELLKQGWSFGDKPGDVT